MNFLKLKNNGNDIWINMSAVTHITRNTERIKTSGGSIVYFAFIHSDGEPGWLGIDQSPEEIWEIKMSDYITAMKP